MLTCIFDSNTLITCCQGYVRGQPVIQHVLNVCEVHVPATVQAEVAAGARFADARLAQALIVSGQIAVQSVHLAPGNILNHYRLGSGEKEAIVLSLDKRASIQYFVTDDQLAYVVARRCGLEVHLFLDLVIELVKQELWTEDLAEEVVDAVQHRFSGGFVPHTKHILRVGNRGQLT